MQVALAEQFSRASQTVFQPIHTISLGRSIALPLLKSTSSCSANSRFAFFNPLVFCLQQLDFIFYFDLQFNESDDMNRIWNSVIIPMNQGGSGGRHVHHKQWYLFEQLDTGKLVLYCLLVKIANSHISFPNHLIQDQFTRLP